MLRNGTMTVLAAAAAIASFSGCGGSGGGGPDGVQLISISFLPAMPGPGGGPNGTTPLPESFRNQALLLQFEAPLDASVFGGFHPQGGAPTEFSGASGDGVAPVPYHAFADQVAAQISVQLWFNAPLGPMVPSYVVGRHRDLPDVVVVDPVVPSMNPFSLPASPGLDPLQEYALIIPATNDLRFGGVAAAPFGPNPASLPLVLPPSSPLPPVPAVWRAITAFAPDPVPPMILAISGVGAAGTVQDPIPPAGSILLTFSKSVSGASFVLGQNVVVRNADVANSQFPLGLEVPGTLTPFTPGFTNDSAWVFTPAMEYGPGILPGQGYDIEVRVGSFGDPQVPSILGLPTGLGGTQLPLANSLAQTFTTAPCAGCALPVMGAIGFASLAMLDGTFVPTFGGPCRWNAPSAPGQLAGREISGSAAGTTPATLGTRMQIVVDPQPPSTIPAGLFGPFDASLANSGGQCGPSGCNLGVNPNGGSHIMHLYESADLGGIEDSLEQFEWSPVNSVAFATVYPNYFLWCGVTNIAAPLVGGPFPGMTAVYDANYVLTPYQTGVPVPVACANPTAVNPRKVPCAPGALPYVVQLATTSFFPFPTLFPCFDFATVGGASGPGVNLLIEQNIAPGSQLPNFNRYRATNFTPVRRLIGRPLELVTPPLCSFNEGGTFDVYRARFTFVGLVAQCRSHWFDTGTANPSYVDFVLTPPVSAQPPGTQSVWVVEGTDVSNPGPGTFGPSAVFVDASGAVNPAALTVIQGLRHFRFRVELRANNLTNQVPAYTSAAMTYTIPAGG
jgi:hypothetical protein